MKKTLLFTAAACLALSASAAPELFAKKQKTNIASGISSRIEKANTTRELKTINAHRAKAAGEVGPVIGEFTGETSTYAMESYVEGYYDADMVVKMQRDGNDVLISGLIPGMFNETVIVKGTVDGNTISIPAQQIYYQYDYYGYYTFDMYISKLTMDEEGNVLTNEDGYPAWTEEPYILQINEDGTIVDPQLNVTEDGVIASFLGVFVNGLEMGLHEREFLTYNAGIKLTPYDGAVAVELPAGAQPEEYIYSYNRSGNAYNEVDEVYVDGTDVYLHGLTFGAGIWVKGTVTDGKLVVPGGQSLGSDANFFMTIEAVNNFVLDDEGYVIGYDLLPALTFTITEDGNYVLDADQNVGLVYLQSRVLGAYMTDLTINKFAGFQPAIPATPYFTAFQNYVDAYGQYFIGFTAPTLGTNNEMLDINNLEWAIYVDDELYEFNAEEGYYLSEPMTWFPAASYVDDRDGYDLKCSGGQVAIYLYDELFSEIGIQSRYHFGDKTYYSNILYIDPVPVEEGYYNVREVEVENEPIDPVGIKQIAATKTINLFDLQGRRADKASKGLVIENGKVNFVK